MKNKRETKLEKREKEIINRLNGKDPTALFVFSLLKLYFYVDDLIYNRNHSKLISEVYVDRKARAKWAQANSCNISHRTSFRYRNLYLQFINALYQESVLSELSTPAASSRCWP